MRTDVRYYALGIIALTDDKDVFCKCYQYLVGNNGTGDAGAGMYNLVMHGDEIERRHRMNRLARKNGNMMKKSIEKKNTRRSGECC